MVTSTYDAIALAVEKVVEEIIEGSSSTSVSFSSSGNQVIKRRVVRILEVGLRTGCLTSKIAARLVKFSKDYDTTDLTSSFFVEASKNLSNFPFVKVRRFDIQADALAQGVRTTLISTW